MHNAAAAARIKIRLVISSCFPIILCGAVVADYTVSETQFPYQILEFLLLCLKFFPGAGAFKTAVDELNFVSLVRKYSCRIREEAIQLSMNLFLHVFIV